MKQDRPARPGYSDGGCRRPRRRWELCPNLVYGGLSEAAYPAGMRMDERGVVDKMPIAS
jgi:hypothetical protein